MTLAYRYTDSYTIEADLIELWTKEKKILTEYSGLLIEQYDKLGLKDLEHLEEAGYGSFPGLAGIKGLKRLRQCCQH
jgi:hypothetical protein